MFKTIVLATDLSPAWNEIVACAGEFKALGCSRVILTYVIVPNSWWGWKKSSGPMSGLSWKRSSNNWRLRDCK